MTSTAPRDSITAPLVELGCGSHKREGFFGIDVAPGSDVDLVLDIEREPLPFADNSVDHIYSSHTFEHLIAAGSPIQTLREIVRVARHGGLVEIWTPHGRNDDAFLFGHAVFYTETHWKHICYMYDDFYLGEGNVGRFNWLRTEYVVHRHTIERLHQLDIPVEFALDHLNNVAVEFGVFLQVDKTTTSAVKPQYPIRELCYERGRVVQRVGPPGEHMRRRIAHSPAGPYLRRLRDEGRRAVSRLR